MMERVNTCTVEGWTVEFKVTVRPIVIYLSFYLTLPVCYDERIYIKNLFNLNIIIEVYPVLMIVWPLIAVGFYLFIYLFAFEVWH